MTVRRAARQQGAIGLQADEPPTIERFALAMSLGVASVRRARQQAKLSLAQQLCHEKKLSLLKTQHMIDLLHKSQEMFFEAGSGQFDDCNAVCMHSGVMRQSLIDVTPFMPVSDFICEYCSCVIIPEEQCAPGEACEAKAIEHKEVLKREQQRKLQLDDETLMLARDVRTARLGRRRSGPQAVFRQEEAAMRPARRPCEQSERRRRRRPMSGCYYSWRARAHVSVGMALCRVPRRFRPRVLRRLPAPLPSAAPRTDDAACGTSCPRRDWADDGG